MITMTYLYVNDLVIVQRYFDSEGKEHAAYGALARVVGFGGAKDPELVLVCFVTGEDERGKYVFDKVNYWTERQYVELYRDN